MGVRATQLVCTEPEIASESVSSTTTRQPRARSILRVVREPLEVVWATRLQESDAYAFDRFLATAETAHYTQTRGWARLTCGAYRYLRPRFFLARREGVVVGAAVVLRPALGPLVGPVGWVERGPVCACASDLADVVFALRSTARRRGCLYLRVMPYFAGDAAVAAEATLGSERFRMVQKFSGSHALTLRIDLSTPLEDAAFAGSAREGLRRKMRAAERAGVRAREVGVSGVDKLEHLYGALMRAQGRASQPARWWCTLARLMHDEPERYGLFVSDLGGEIVATTLAARVGSRATFIMGASSLAKLPFSKAALSMAAAIRWAHRSGCKEFDLGGIPMPGDSDEKRRAIAQFKFDFSKTAVALTRAHARWF